MMMVVIQNHLYITMRTLMMFESANGTFGANRTYIHRREQQRHDTTTKQQAEIVFN